jgi:hypothetical protein
MFKNATFLSFYFADYQLFSNSETLVKNFSGELTFMFRLLIFIDKNEITQIAKKNEAERYVKKFITYHHLVVMLYASIEGYHSIRETILVFWANAHISFPIWAYTIWCEEAPYLRLMLDVLVESLRIFT